MADIQTVLSRLQNVKRSGDNITARCPNHEDKQNSLSVSAGDKGIVIYCHAGCAADDVLSKMGLTMRDLFYEQKKPPSGGSDKGEFDIAYDYVDADGKLLHQTVRYKNPKTFLQRRPDPNSAGKWIWSLKGIMPVIYKLPQVITAAKEKKPVFIVEGEKDADNLMKLGFTATTSPMGAGKWRKHYSDYFTGSITYIIADNDSTGQEHCINICRALIGKAATVKVIDLKKELPELPPKGDITDFFKTLGKEEGLTRFQRLIDTALDFNESVADTQSKPLYINAADIAPRSVPWLIPNFIVRGALNGVRGLPNSGKSWITCALACSVADGGKWFNEYGEFSDVPQGRVLIANFDDDASYTIIPRLRDCGVTDNGIRNISILDRSACVDLNFYDERLTDIFEKTKPDLAIFDTLQHFLGAKADMNRANEMNAALVNLQRLAEKYNTAVILVEHINKAAANGNAGHSLNWGLGSTAIPGLMRTAWTIGELRDETHEEGTKAIVCSKYNLMKSAPPARLFQIKGEYGGLVWCGVDDDISAFDLIKPDNKRERGRPPEQADRAEEIILKALRENGGEMLSDNLKNIVLKHGISERTYKTVKSSMGIPSYQRQRKWYVTVPKSSDNKILHSDDDNELLRSDRKGHKITQTHINTSFGEI